MKTNTPPTGFANLSAVARLLARPLWVLCISLFTVMSPVSHAADTGTITGVISNTATGNHLEGVRVSVPKLGASVLTDNTGRYVISGVPEGTYEVVAKYIGLDEAMSAVTVSAGQRAVRNFEMTSAIYKLNAFTVTGEREGNAAMITEKKNAYNVKDVIAMDSFGYLPNMSAGEVVMRLPGVAGSPTDEGLNNQFNIRGMSAALNNVTVDGGSFTTISTGRALGLQLMAGAMFEGVEVIKGQTPDKGADSLGGTINFKTRSTLSMKEDRRTTYNFSTRWAPPFFEQTPLRSEHRAHPVLNLTHQQVFSIFGGNRNLGTSLNLFYSENVIGGFEANFERTNALNGPAPIFSYNTWDNFNNRKQMSVALKTDYQWSPTTKFSLSVIRNDNFERHRRRVRVTATAGTPTTVPSATTGIIPGEFTATVTKVRPLNSNMLDVEMIGPGNFYNRMGRVDLTGEHTYTNLSVEYTGGIARTAVNGGTGRGGHLNMRLFDPSIQVAGRPVRFGGAGWIIDQTQSELHPQFSQNGGPDFTDPNNWLPRATDGLTYNRNEFDQLLKQFRFDARYRLPLSAPTYLKAGFHWRSLDLDQWGKDRRRWVPKAVLAYDPNVRFTPDTSYVSYDLVKTGRNIPIWQPANGITSDGRPADPGLWTEDLYFNESQKYIGTNGLTETIGARYIMADGRFGRDGWLGRTGFLGGIRFEDVRVRSWGWVRARVISSAAQQAADPIGSATRDYADNYRPLYGKFSQKFPSIHVYHDITSNLKARLSYSTGYGRAPLNNLLPNETPDDVNRRVTVNNPGLRPQQAKNWDATVEYYFEPVGSLTFGWFHKDISDFIITGQDIGIVSGGTNNGFDGEYEGYTLRTALNAGTVTVHGWEFAYNQQYTFLPGVLKGLSGSFNYSWTNQYGMQSGGRYLTRRDIAGFIPHTANASLNWRYHKFSARALYNFSGENVTSFNAANPALSVFRYSMKTLNVGVGYQHRPNLGFTIDASNVLNEPQRWYQGYKDRMRRTNINFVTVTVGVNGRF